VQSVQHNINLHGTFVPTNFTVAHFTALHFKTKSLYINQVSSLHIISLHVTSPIYTQSPFEFPMLVTTFLTRFIKVFILRGKDASKPADNWSKLLMVLFKKEYLPEFVLFS